MYRLRLDVLRKIKADSLSASEKSSTSSHISWESSGGRAVIRRCKCPFIFHFFPNRMCVCVNAIWLMSCWFCTFKEASILPVWLMLLPLVSNAPSLCCRRLLAAHFQAPSFPGKLPWVTVVWWYFSAAVDRMGAPAELFTLLVHPWWASTRSQPGCKRPPFPRKPGARSAQPGSESIRGCPKPHCAPFYSVWRERKIHSQARFAIHEHIWLGDPCLPGRFLHLIRKERRGLRSFWCRKHNRFSETPKNGAAFCWLKGKLMSGFVRFQSVFF